MANGKKPFYQCQTCDPSKQVYLCSYCFNKGNHRHQNHTFTQQTNYSEIVFCNCGDITGKLCCSEHRLFQIKNELRLPLHFNEKFFDEFIDELGVPAQSARQLARLNRIKRVFFKSDDGRMIKAYFDQTNAHKTTMYYRKAYSIYRRDHEKRFVDKGFHKERRHLLWHGTKLTNLESILQIGFQLPNGAVGVANGSMFGAGVYFADRVSKSANYTDGSGNEILFLCEVALGSMYPTGSPQDSAPGAFNSIKGLGTNVPDESDQGLLDEIIVPFGETIQSRQSVDTHLNYNEYVVYDQARILIRFVVQFDRNPFNNPRNSNARGLQFPQQSQPFGQLRTQPSLPRSNINRIQNSQSVFGSTQSASGGQRQNAIGSMAVRPLISNGIPSRASTSGMLPTNAVPRASTITPRTYGYPITTPSASQSIARTPTVSTSWQPSSPSSYGYTTVPQQRRSLPRDKGCCVIL